MIVAALDGDLKCLASGHRVWMPAHQKLSAVGEKKLSSGKRLWHIDWRANRLVVELAKVSAEEVRTWDSVRRLLESIAAAVSHFAKLLGRVTQAANNHMVEVGGQDGPDGVPGECTLRDSVDAPRHVRQRHPQPPPATETLRLSASLFALGNPQRRPALAPAARAGMRPTCRGSRRRASGANRQDASLGQAAGFEGQSAAGPAAGLSDMRLQGWGMR